MIEVEQISKIYQVHQKEPGFWGSVRSLVSRKTTEKAALLDVSLKVARGEIIGLLGSNGAGKTTLVKILSGIVQPSRGRATVLGFDPSRRPIELRRQMALIMGQKAQLWWDLPAADAFLLLQEIYQIRKSDFDDRVKVLSQALEVEGQLKTPIRRLSLGERMKMELMAALLHRPQVIFLDEPTIGLDISAQKSIRKFLKDYMRTESPAVILTSHYLEDIEDLCQRVAILRQGRMVYDGRLADLSGTATRTKKLRFTLMNFDSTRDGEMGRVRAFHDKWSLQKKTDEIASGASMSLDVARDHLPACISELLREFQVDDLLVQEEDLSHFIEQVQRGRA